MAGDRRGVSLLGTAARVVGVLAALAFVALLGYGLAARSPDRSIDDALADKRAIAAPGFDLAVLTAGRPGRLGPVWTRAAADGRVGLAELRGTPIVLNFWASWCDPCREEAPLLQRGWQSAQRRGVLFVGLDMQDVREDAMNFLHEFRVDYPNVEDPTKATAKRWGVSGIPETFFINGAGEVVAHVIGVVTRSQLDRGVQAALGGRASGAGRGGQHRPTR